MNIFLTDSDPVKCAQVLDDLRLNKMILETGQMLCTAYRHWAKHYGDWPTTFKDIYKETHANHPCNVWLRKSIANYLWCYDLFIALCDEKEFRTEKVHLTRTKLEDYLVPVLIIDPKVDEPVKFSFDCSNVLEQNPTSIFNRYKQCLIAKWNADNRPPSWNNRGAPFWAGPYKPGCDVTKRTQFKLI